MFLNVHSVAMYVADLSAAVSLYRDLGLNVAWSEGEEDATRTSPGVPGCRRVGLSYPRGGPELILHDDPARQFTELTVLVDDLGALYRRLANHPNYIWFEPPHPTENGCTAFVRTPDGNVLTLVGRNCTGSHPFRSCDQRAQGA